MARYHCTGQGRSYIIAPGYRYESSPHARLERPEGEPSILVGASLCLSVIVTGAACFYALFGGMA